MSPPLKFPARRNTFGRTTDPLGARGAAAGAEGPREMSLDVAGLIGPLGGAPISSASLRPEERLMVEVLALACANLGLAARGPAAAQVRKGARQWIESDAEVWPLAFAHICRHFGIDPGAARAAVLRRAHSPRHPDQPLARCS